MKRIDLRAWGLALLLALLSASTEPAFAGPCFKIATGDCVDKFVPVDGNGVVITPGPSASSAVGITPVVSSAVENSHVLKASAGNFYGASVTSGASSGYVLLFDATSAPADGAVTPKACFAMAANSTLGITYGGVPLVAATGITIVFSTTGCFTKTASATAFFSAQVQ